MSMWTHVAAVVRIDDLPFLKKTDWQAYFGKECLFDDPSEVWKDAEEHPDEYLPKGSEGSLRSSLWINPDRYSAAAYTLTIFGDLRDYDSPYPVLEWFKKKLEGIPLVRQATITVETEGVETLNYTYVEEDE